MTTAIDLAEERLSTERSTSYRRIMLSLLWALRHPSRPFTQKADIELYDSLYYRSRDGAYNPLLRFPCEGGTPVVVATGPVLHPRIFGLFKEGLVQQLHRHEFDVYLFTHRDHPGSTPGREDGSFDSILNLDLPAAVDAIRRYTGASKVLWIGHAMGGQLLYSWLSQGGSMDIAAGVAIDAPVGFPSSQHSRSTSILRHLLPKRGNVPFERFAPLKAFREPSLSCSQLSAVETRTIMMHAVTKLPNALLRQLLLWLDGGTLSSKDGRIDYGMACRERNLPLRLMYSPRSPLGAPEMTLPITENLGNVELVEGEWETVPFLSQESSNGMGDLLEWLSQYRRHCWE